MGSDEQVLQKHKGLAEENGMKRQSCEDLGGAAVCAT